jgi:glutamate synthase domain-containing protein 2|tara:strand:- start:1490 stop:3046 length:1557 start_codon:yes stop_codon:yes gene_type:complete
MHVRQKFILISILVLGLIAAIYLYWPPILWSLIIILPLVSLGVFDMLQNKHAIRKNFPVIGNLRYILESIRPEIMQYFVETDTEGKPFDRIERTMVYERAKNVSDTTPFGTQSDVNAIGYEWMNHSIYAKDEHEMNFDPRVIIGGKDCKQPYSASILNISAMSYGSLSMNAVQAMNKGAKKGEFAQNTGEGGVSSHHLNFGGDLIWQIGTGYFGCRTKEGGFSPETFQKTALKDNVKMIEIKLSQGAKPGHGGILPAVKNTEEIAAIRHVEPHITVYSPPRHKVFQDAEGLMNFVKQLRELSNGKPIGFKLCVGNKEEFLDICRAMVKTNILPDFITVDGGEGGTGAAPVEFSNSLGAPLVNGLTFVHNALITFDLKKEIKIIASGKIVSGFHIARSLALGADLCNSARAMMMAVGCIQALQCDTNKCPTGVATQDKQLMKGLDVGDKSERVANFHKRTIKSFVEMLGAAGYAEPSELNRSHIFTRVDLNQIVTLEEIYPYSKVGTIRDKSELIYQQT